jgi:hypothetical protein
MGDVAIRIGPRAQCVLMLDDRSTPATLGLRRVVGDTFEGPREAWEAVAREYSDRGDRYAGWDLDAGDRAACRRAAATIGRALVGDRGESALVNIRGSAPSKRVEDENHG